MNTFQKIEQWSDKHQNVFMDGLRMLLGLVLVIKGIQFGLHPHDVKVLVSQTPFSFMSFMILHYIIMVHLAGGVMIMLGVATRIAIIFQLPVLIGAILFVHRSAMFSFYSEHGLAIGILALLLVFLFYGSGRLSYDEFMKHSAA
jgi:putative oxidoreductase